jgi:hypothetical protein
MASKILGNPAYRFKRIGLEAGPLSQWLFSALAEAALPPSAIDPALIGTWEITVANDRGLSRWIWHIMRDGTYEFRAEGRAPRRRMKARLRPRTVIGRYTQTRGSRVTTTAAHTKSGTQGRPPTTAIGDEKPGERFLRVGPRWALRLPFREV